MTQADATTEDKDYAPLKTNASFFGIDTRPTDVFDDETRPFPPELVEALGDTPLLTEEEALAFVKDFEPTPSVPTDADRNDGTGQVDAVEDEDGTSVAERAKHKVANAIWISELMDAYRFPPYPERIRDDHDEEAETNAAAPDLISVPCKWKIAYDTTEKDDVIAYARTVFDACRLNNSLPEDTTVDPAGDAEDALLTSPETHDQKIYALHKLGDVDVDAAFALVIRELDRGDVLESRIPIASYATASSLADRVTKTATVEPWIQAQDYVVHDDQTCQLVHVGPRPTIELPDGTIKEVRWSDITTWAQEPE